MPISRKLFNCYSDEGKQLVPDDELREAIEQSREECKMLPTTFEQRLAELKIKQ